MEKAYKSEQERRAEFHAELKVACEEGFEAGTKGATSCKYWPGSPKKAAWEACYQLGRRFSQGEGRDSTEDRLDDMVGLMVELAGKVAELKTARGVHG